VICHPEHRAGLAQKRGIGRPDWQDCIALRLQPGDHLRSLVRGARSNKNLRHKSLIQPSGKGQPETGHHRANPDVCRQCQQQRHQGQRQTGQLLAGISPEPLCQNTARAALRKCSQHGQQNWQKHGRPQQNAAKHRKPGPQSTGQTAQKPRPTQQRQTNHRLRTQLARRCPCPSARLCRGQHRQTPQTPQTLRGRQQRASNRNAKTRYPPTGAQRKRARHICPVKPAQSGGNIGQKGGRHTVAQCHPRHPRNQRQHQQFRQQHTCQGPRRKPQRPQRAKHRAALFKRQPDRGINDEQTHHKRQQSKGGQIKMETVGQAGQIFARVRLLQA